MLEFKEQVFYQVPFFVGVPICIAGLFCGDAAWNYYNSAALLNPVYQLVAIVPLVRDDHSALQIKRFQKGLRHTDVIAVAAR